MKIHVPKDLGDELPLLPDGPCTAVIKDISVKQNAKTKNYQMYVKWIITSEMYKEDDKSSVGEPVLDNYALVDAALWRLNNLCKGVIDESLNDILLEATGQEEGDIEVDELVKILTEKLKGLEAHLLLEAETYEGKARTKVKTVAQEPIGEAESTSGVTFD